jgi:tripartite-type tricarboxylate transporter receptor subunit TctC
MAEPAVRERFGKTDLEPHTTTPDQFGAYIRSEIAKWAKVIRQSGFTIE